MQYVKNNFLSVITLILLVCVLLAGIKAQENLTEQINSLDSNTKIEENIINNTVEITNEGDDLSYAASKGLQSTVSVYCAYKTASSGTWPRNPTPSEQTYYSAGSGVIYELDENGSCFIITNYHVVYDADCNTSNHISDSIYVYLYGRESEEYAIKATYVGGSANYDIAVLRADGSEVLASAYASGTVRSVDIGSSNDICAGDVAIAIGNPSASTVSGISVTRGIVSVDSEYITMTGADEKSEVTYRVIRVDTPINSGNSGGGLFNSEGDLIGIVNAKISSSDIENIGYAIPSSIVRAIADNIIDYCYGTDNESVMRCILGITVSTQALDTYYDEQNGKLYKSETVSVYSVSTDGIAYNSLKSGDIIKSVTVGGTTVKITRQHHLIDAMLYARAGDEIIFTVLRDGELTDVSIVVDEDCLTQY